MTSKYQFLNYNPNSKFKPKLNFRTDSHHLISLNPDNLTDELVEAAIDKGFGHLFCKVKHVSEKKSPLNYPSVESISISKEAQKEEEDLLPAQPNKRKDSLSKVEPKKRGRKPKA